GLLDGGADLLLVETIFDTLNAKAALYAISEICEARGIDVPVVVSGTITDKSGRLLPGLLPEASWNSVRRVGTILIGLKWALGAGAVRAHARDSLRQRRGAHQRHGLGAIPQAGHRGRLQRGVASGARPGRERRADHRRQHGRGAAGFRKSDGDVPQPRRRGA